MKSPAQNHSISPDSLKLKRKPPQKRDLDLSEEEFDILKNTLSMLQKDFDTLEESNNRTFHLNTINKIDMKLLCYCKKYSERPQLKKELFLNQLEYLILQKAFSLIVDLVISSDNHETRIYNLKSVFSLSDKLTAYWNKYFYKGRWTGCQET